RVVLELFAAAVDHDQEARRDDLRIQDSGLRTAQRRIAPLTCLDLLHTDLAGGNPQVRRRVLQRRCDSLLLIRAQVRSRYWADQRRHRGLWRGGHRRRAWQPWVLSAPAQSQDKRQPQPRARTSHASETLPLAARNNRLTASCGLQRPASRESTRVQPRV